MHPAPSLILFTTLSGLGFGLLAFLCLGMPPVTGTTAAIFFGIAYALTCGGLLFSALHLGHPERALKAFTQWRSSWLSREAWVSVAALVVTAAYAATVLRLDFRAFTFGVPGAALSIGTVYATSMIYRQLKAVPRWHHKSTTWLFIAHALAGGALLSGQIALAIPLLLLLGAVQLWAWISGDRRFAASGTTLATATGLGAEGHVRSFEPPHTGTSYLLTEMVHVIGRKHALKLRIIGFVLVVIVPVFALAALPFSHSLAALAVLSHIAGAFVCRWLFFAEAEHVVGLYYGRRVPA